MSDFERISRQETVNVLFRYNIVYPAILNAVYIYIFEYNMWYSTTLSILFYASSIKKTYEYISKNNVVVAIKFFYLKGILIKQIFIRIFFSLFGFLGLIVYYMINFTSGARERLNCTIQCLYSEYINEIFISVSLSASLFFLTIAFFYYILEEDFYDS